MGRQTASRAPVLVVSPERAGTVPLLTTLLRDSPDVAVVVDRRNGERRLGDRGRPENAGWADGERRIDERRRGPSLYLV
jgi:hypothetical protein